jgi:tripeptide aminopeptidase
MPIQSPPKRTRTATPGPNGHFVRSTIPEPDLDAAFDLAMELMAIPGRSGEEGIIIEFVRRRLLAAGAPASALAFDDTPKHSPIGGLTGGLILQLPGTLRAPRRLLMAHVDTVPLCVGARPVRKGKFVRSADKTTGLGADDRAGAAVVLTAAMEILRRGLPHPPLTLFWPVQEEVGLYGARHVSLNLLGKPKLAFNWDGGDADKLTIGATGAYRLQITIEGLASHAGGAPEYGVSAIAIAGRAIADLDEHGWHGDINKSGRHGTSNIGVIHGGEATNVVTDRVELRAEARSHDPKFRREILQTIERAFAKAAREVRNVEGRCGKVTIASRLDYESFRLADTEPCVLAAEHAVAGIGRQPYRAVTNGGLDANWLTARGIPTVTLGCGQMFPHTVREQLDVAAFRSACRVGLRLATATETGERGTSVP